MDWTKYKKYLEGLKDYKVWMALIGGILVSAKYACLGNGIWTIVDLLWVMHFKKKQDYSAMMLFILYTIISLYGFINWM